jgi:hypothetical protein
VRKNNQSMSNKNEKPPPRETIELRAYQIYLQRGCEQGHDLADWLAGEEQLTRHVESEASESRSGDSPRTGIRKPGRANAA